MKKKDKISTTRFLLSFARITRRTEASLLRFRYVFIPTVYMFLSCVTIKTSGDINVDTDFFFLREQRSFFHDRKLSENCHARISLETRILNLYTRTHAHTYIHIHTHVHTHTYVYIHVYVYVCTLGISLNKFL